MAKPSEKEMLEDGLRKSLRSAGVGEKTTAKVLSVLRRIGAFKCIIRQEDSFRVNPAVYPTINGRVPSTKYGPTIGFPKDLEVIPRMKFPKVKGEVTTWKKLLESEGKKQMKRKSGREASRKTNSRI